MSNLLEKAIVDAKALKEAALKNAEQLVIEKYQLEVKQAMDQLLEQDDADALADLFGTETPESPEATGEEGQGTEDEASINPDDLEAQVPDAFRMDDDEVIQIQLNSIEDDIEDEEEGPFAGDNEYEDEEVGIDIQDDEEISDIDTDLGMGDDIGIDITGDAPMSAEALEELIASALQDILSEEEEVNESGCEEGHRKKKKKKKKLKEEDEINEEEELDEEIDLDELMERVRVEGEPQKSGWAGTPESIMREYESMLLARQQDSEVKEENEELRKNVSALQKENKTLSSAALKLQEQNKEYMSAFDTLQEKLETLNVSNAKLLYINQALENASLNERQKRKIVEAISKAETVQEAKIVFETMNDTVATTSDVKQDRTLSEMVSRKSSLLVAARKEQPKDANPMYNRLQTLAGIKTK